MLLCVHEYACACVQHRYIYTPTCQVGIIKGAYILQYKNIKGCNCREITILSISRINCMLAHI